MNDLIFPLIMTGVVVLIVIMKEFRATVNNLPSNVKNILFLAEPVIYSLFSFSWLLLVDWNIFITILFSIVLGIFLFIIITGSFINGTVNNSIGKSYNPEELINKCVIIRDESDNDKQYLGELVGEGVDIVITSSEKLVKNDVVQIVSIDRNNIIANKINK